jgi:carbon monoxide dehydrogenase subunit G
VVPAERSEIWRVLTDPDLLPRLTPLLRRIDADGNLWRWQLMRISVLGVGISPCFTERMRFEEGRRIDFTHEPPPGVVERAGADGSYLLSDVPEGSHLTIKLNLHVDLPLSKAVTPVVTAAMRDTMRRMGNRFASNLHQQLGVDKPLTTRR